MGFILRDQACHNVYSTAADPAAWVHRVTVTNVYVALLGMLVHEQATQQHIEMASDFIATRTTCKGHVKRAPSFGAWAATSLAQVAGELEAMGVVGLDQWKEQDLQGFWVERSEGITQKLLVMDAVSSCLRPVGEAVIVADRAAYLLERGHSVNVTSMFDPCLSARNWVIAAIKHRA